MPTTLTTTRRRKQALAAVSTALLSFSAGSGVAAAATDPGSKPPAADPAPFRYASDLDRKRMEHQTPLIAAARPITEAAEQDAAGNGASGFTSVALGPDSVVLAWKGALPTAVRDAVAEARKKADVDVVAAKHSRAQLHNAAERVKRAMLEGTDRAPFAVQIPSDGSELIVDTEGDVEKAKRKLPAVNVPITVRRQEVAEPKSRLSDYAPFWGGARMRNADNGAGCSSGFSVTDGWHNYILTAGHCGRPGGGWYNGDWTRWVGTASREDLSGDLLLIPAYVGNRIYDGGVGSGEFSKYVAFQEYTWAGEWLCVSGSVTGAVCGVQNSNNFTYSYCVTNMYGSYECYVSLVSAYQRDNRRAAAPGDSGGPVFNLWGWDGVVAKGIISGGNSAGTHILYQDMAHANQTLGVRTI